MTGNDAVAQLKSLLGDDALVEKLAEALAQKVSSRQAPKYPDSSKADELVEASEYSYARGRIYLDTAAVKAVALAIKNQETTIVEAPEANVKKGIHGFVVFPDGNGGAAIQSLYKPSV